MRSRSIRSSFGISTPLRTITEMTTAYGWFGNESPTQSATTSRSMDALHVRLNGFV